MRLACHILIPSTLKFCCKHFSCWDCLCHLQRPRHPLINLHQVSEEFLHCGIGGVLRRRNVQSQTGQQLSWPRSLNRVLTPPRSCMGKVFSGASLIHYGYQICPVLLRSTYTAPHTLMGSLTTRLPMILLASHMCLCHERPSVSQRRLRWEA